MSVKYLRDSNANKVASLAYFFAITVTGGRGIGGEVKRQIVSFDRQKDSIAGSAFEIFPSGAGL